MSKTFTAQNPATGQAVGAEIAEWDLVQTSAAIKAAESVKAKLASTNPTQRAALLNAIADAISRNGKSQKSQNKRKQKAYKK